jgi:hypothetical protein
VEALQPSSCVVIRLRGAALASSVVASTPIVFPLTKPLVPKPQHPGEHRAVRLDQTPERALDSRTCWSAHVYS